MPRKNPKLVLAAGRAAEARRIVAGQQLLIETLKASGQPTLEAVRSLQLYMSALGTLEGHERRPREERRAKTRAKPEIDQSDRPQFSDPAAEDFEPASGRSGQ
jgi:nucleoid DNA-binding protein